MSDTTGGTTPADASGRGAAVYNSAKTWQIGFFALNNTATNLYLFMFMFVSYYATGIAGLLVVAVSTILTAMRIWDGVTDPIIGFIMDRTETKFGKFRPFMVGGNVVLALLALVIFKTTHLVPEGFRLIYFILMYAIYTIGYTFQTAATKAAQTALTNDPKQRPLFTLFDGIYNTALFVGMQLFVSSYLVPTHGGFTQPLFDQLLLVTIAVSALFTVLAVISLWNKDVKEFWGAGQAVRVKFSDYLDVLKNNRPLQMLIISASTDKLAALTTRNAVTQVIIYGIVMGNYALSGTLQAVTTIPTILITFIGVAYARRTGIRRAYVLFTQLSIVFAVAIFLLFVVGDVTTISLAGINAITVIYLLLFSLFGGAMSVGGNIVIPMIADCADYETSRSGRYVPGMMGTLFSFVDKLISSLATTFVGLAVALIGFREAFPTVDTPNSPQLFAMGMFLFLGMPVLGWVASLIAMRFYRLDAAEMRTIGETLHDRREAAAPADGQ